MSTIPTKQSSDEIDCKWGDMPPQDIPGQLTRSMLEMRKPKAFELKELPSLPLHACSARASGEVQIPSCPILQHSLKLLMYIRQANSLISNLESKPYAIHGQANQIAELSMPPPFESNESSLAYKGTSKSSSSESRSGKSYHGLFSVPEPDMSRDGADDCGLPPIGQDAVRTLLKDSVQAIAAHAGYEEMTTLCLNGLAGITRNFLESFSKLLRGALDREAETGCPPFYDVLGEVLNDSGTKSLEDLQIFWNTQIVQRHENLEKLAASLSVEVRSLSYRVHEVDADAMHATRSKFGKWAPVAGMRSGTDIGRRRDPTVAGSTKCQIKSEYHNYMYRDMPNSVTDRKPSQENPFEFDDGVDSTYGIGELDNHHLTKRPRNAL